MKEYEVNKCYLLQPGKYYYIPSLQEAVIFKDPMAVKLTNFFYGKPAFGTLIKIGKGPFHTDYCSDIEIEITSELGEEYIPNTSGISLFDLYKNLC